MQRASGEAIKVKTETAVAVAVAGTRLGGVRGGRGGDDGWLLGRRGNLFMMKSSEIYQ